MFYMDKLVVKIIPVLQKYGVTKASLFGSYARGEEKKPVILTYLLNLQKG
jgi:predicted nucleotidyltransferase